MRFEVPQYIEIEDKIFGPLSWRQFLYLGGGAGMATVFFLTTPLIIFIIFGIPIALVSAALAFYPVNNRPFSFFLEAIFTYIKGNKLYLWRQKSEIIHRGKEKFIPSQLYPEEYPTTDRPSFLPRSAKEELEALNNSK